MKRIRKSEARKYWDVRNTANGLVAYDEEPAEPQDFVSVPVSRLKDALATEADTDAIRDAREREDRVTAVPIYDARLAELEGD